MKKFLFICLVTPGLGFISTAEADLSFARSIRCEAFPNALGVSLQRSGNNLSGPLIGSANHNYSTANFNLCKNTVNEVRCSGQWLSGGGPANFRMISQSDGTFKGFLQVPGGKVIGLACLPSANGL